MGGINFAKFQKTTRSSHRSQQFLEGKASRTKWVVNAGIRINAPRSSSSSSSSSSPHGVEPLDRFVPVEHPSEPFDIDQPLRCPRTEPGIVHDARIWKERLSARLQRSSDLLGEISFPSSKYGT